MRAILASIGTRGDIQPILALGQSLRRRGHEALIACPSSFAPWVRALGFAHHPLGDDTLARMAAQIEPSSLADIRRYIAEKFPLQFPELLHIASSGADAIVATGLALSGTSVAERLGIPALKLTFSTAALPSPRHPPPFVPWQGLPSWLNRLLWRISNSMQERMMKPAVNAGRADIGLAPLTHLGRHLFLDTPTVIAADEALFPPDPTWQGRYPHSGFLFLDDPAPLDPALEAWLAAGEPPLFVGFGSMKGPKRARDSARLRAALLATGRRCLVADGDLAAELPRDRDRDRVYVVREAPHERLFPRVAAVVHHGGSGTTASALRAGVPQIVMPLVLDQFHNAHALRRAGLAPKAPALSRVTPGSFARALDEALALPAERRQAAAERLRRSDAGSAITSMLERAVVTATACAAAAPSGAPRVPFS